MKMLIFKKSMFDILLFYQTKPNRYLLKLSVEYDGATAHCIVLKIAKTPNLNPLDFFL